jgi:hypothetical protein
MNIPSSLLPVFYGATGGIIASAVGIVTGLLILSSRQRPWVVRLLWMSVGVCVASIAAIVIVMTSRAVG